MYVFNLVESTIKLRACFTLCEKNIYLPKIQWVTIVNGTWIPSHIKGSKISLIENEWLVYNMLDIVFCGGTEHTTENK